MFKDISFALSHDTIMICSKFTVSTNEGKSFPVQKNWVISKQYGKKFGWDKGKVIYI